MFAAAFSRSSRGLVASREAIWSARAEDNLAEAALYLNSQREGLGQELVARAFDVIERARRSPEIYPKVGRRVRRGLTGRFSYAVFYAWDSQLSTVVVLAVVHTSRDPKSWPEEP